MSQNDLHVKCKYGTMPKPDYPRSKPIGYMPYFSMKEEIVITGISGKYPESPNVEEFEKNLYNGVDMVTEDERRWAKDFFGVSVGMGKLKIVEKFDSEFFNKSEFEANYMDSQIRMMIELAYEAIWDSGIDPTSLSGTNTGVFIGNCFDEYLNAYSNCMNLVGFRQVISSSISEIFNLKGPAVVIDTACASSFNALNEAMISLRNNRCDRALVVGINLGFNPIIQLQFFKMNMLSKTGRCRCLDSSADGYAKGEACVAILLQRRPEAKRIYATILHTKTNNDGYEEMGITFPSWETQRDIMVETYAEAKVNPNDVPYIESHCTGTQAGDPEEMRAITLSMCKDRKEPLLIGAHKSNIGHTEAASGLCAVTKAIISFENELIPQNLHLKKPNPKIDGLMSGILKPINENLPFFGDIVGLNNFGFGGSNVHVIVKSPKIRAKHGNNRIIEEIPRLVQICGRNEETVNFFFDKLMENQKKLTRDSLALINEISKTPPTTTGVGYNGMKYRGFTIIENGDQNAYMNTKPKIEEVSKTDRQIWYVFSGMGTQWSAMAKSIMDIEIIRRSILKSAQYINHLGIDLIKLLTDDNQNIKDSVINSFVTIAAIQIAFVDLLSELGIKPDGIMGHSIGEMVCGYADGCLTAKETILSAYWRGKCIYDYNNGNGMMAAVGLSYGETQKLCPKYVYIACDNSDDSVTVSGEKAIIEKFMDELKMKGIFTAKVESSGVAFHCQLIYSMNQQLLSKLRTIITNKKTISSKWLSTTYSMSEMKKQKNELTAQYFVDNLIFPVLFNDALKQIPKDAIVIEIAPHCLLQSIIKRSLGPDIGYVSVMRRNVDNMNIVLSSIGSLYNLGLNPKIEKLYPKVSFPVSNGTLMLSNLVKWDHQKSWVVTKWPEFFNLREKCMKGFDVDLMDKVDTYIAGHKIDGKNLYPGTGYLLFAWKQLADLYHTTFEEFPVEFTDVTLHRATIVQKTGKTSFQSTYDDKMHKFFILESGQVVVSGTIRILTEKLKYGNILDKNPFDLIPNQNKIVLETKDIYKELRLRGYSYSNKFQGITKAFVDKKMVKAEVEWVDNWVTFADTMIQISILGIPFRGLFIPVRIAELRCDPILLRAEAALGDGKLKAIFDYDLNIGVAKGFEYRGVKANLVQRNITAKKPVFGHYSFMPFNEKLNYKNDKYLKQYSKICDRLAVKVAKKYNRLQMDFLSNMNTTVDFDENIDENEMNNHLNIENKYIFKYLNDISKSNDTDIHSMKNLNEKLSEIESDLILSSFHNIDLIDTHLVNIYENKSSYDLNVLEINDSTSIMRKNTLRVFSDYDFDIRVSYGCLHSDPDILSEEQSEELEIKGCLENSKIPKDLTDLDLIIYRDSSVHPLTCGVTHDLDILFESFWDKLKNNGFAFIICRDNLTLAEKVMCSLFDKPIFNSRKNVIKEKAKKFGFTIIGETVDQFSANALLFKKINTELPIEKQTFIEITEEFEKWIEPLKKEMKIIGTKPEGENIWLISRNDPMSGIIGLFNCLKREPNGNRLRCILMGDKSKPQLLSDLSANNKELQSYISKDLRLNIFFNNDYGYYKVNKVDSVSEPVNTEHCFLNCVTRGDLSSLKWFESQHKYWPLDKKPGEVLCQVYYSALNFRDIMLATGRLPADALPVEIGLQDCILGLEFSGRDENGNRVMGMTPSKALATTCVIDDIEFLWPIPDNWTMEDASTVPCVYSTAYYALIIRGKLQKGEKVLIHSGSGGVGQAAINICLSMGCKLFITVGTQAKRDFLKKLYPSLTDNNFSSSRDILFKNHIMHETNSLGVDVILNSLAEEKLVASLECLANNGRFLEIGKFDMSQNNRLEISELIQNKSFHGIHLDSLFGKKDNLPKHVVKDRQKIWELIQEGIRNGIVRPLNRNVFDMNESEEAFRFMASGKHMGKVVIKIRDEEINNKNMTLFRTIAQPRTVFYPNKSYIISGGLGGMGVELINWMIERGAKHFLVTSRTGPKDPYQFSRLKSFADSGADIQIFTEDISKLKGAENLLKTASKMAKIGGIFHMAMIIADGLFENQTADMFRSAYLPKSVALKNLDIVSRKMCPDIDYFVAYSSGVSNRGNAGQSNYGYSNAIMDRICDLRRKDGLHGLALLWGVIGDVGFVAENLDDEGIIVAGTVAQKMNSVLASLDSLLQTKHAIVTCFVKSEPKFDSGGGKTDLMKRVAHIIGIDDYTKLDPNTKLIKLGMDSLMAVEIQQSIERDFNIALTSEQLRDITIAKVKDINSLAKLAAAEAEAKKCNQLP